MVRSIRSRSKKKRQFVRDDGSGLWLPSTITKERRVNPFIQNIHLSLGYRGITGARTTWDAVEDRLRRHALRPLVAVICNIASFVEPARDHADDPQKELVRTFLPPALGVPAWRLLERYRAQGDTAVLFHRAQVLSLLKVALRVVPDLPDTRSEVTEFHSIGEALLMMSDLVEEANVPEMDAPLDRVMFANGLFNVNENAAHTLARSYDLYLTDRPHLHGTGNYVNLPDVARRATGVDADTLWAILFAVVSTVHPDPKNGKVHPRTLKRGTYFAPNSEERLGQFLGTVVADLAAMKAAASAFTRDVLQPFNMKPFLEHPLIQLDEYIVTVTPELALQRLGRGLHFLGLQPNFTPKERDRYLIYVGDVFEDYAHQLLTRCFGDRYVPLEAVRGEYPDGLADGIIDYGDEAIVVEAKAKFFPVGVRAGIDQEGLDRKLDETIVRAARQITDTVEAVVRGDVGAGRFSRVKRWYPLVLTLERMPLIPSLYASLSKTISERGYVAPPRFAPWQVVDVDDIEFLEESLAQGSSLLDLLRMKTDDQATRFESLGKGADLLLSTAR